MPVGAMPELKLPKPDRRAWLDYMPGADVPVIRQPFAAGDQLPFWSAGMRATEHHLYDLANDPDEVQNRVGSAAEVRQIELLRVALKAVDAPEEQLVRLGIA